MKTGLLAVALPAICSEAAALDGPPGKTMGNPEIEGPLARPTPFRQNYSIRGG
jgi:hypothetical protein